MQALKAMTELMVHKQHSLGDEGWNQLTAALNFGIHRPKKQFKLHTNNSGI